LVTDGIDQLEAEEARLRPLHTAMAQSVGVKYKDRMPAEVIEKLRNEVATRWYPNRMEFERALLGAGVPAGFVQQLKESAATSVDSGPAEKYVRENLFRYDYSLPRIR
jgi:hypothetical protein